MRGREDRPHGSGRMSQPKEDGMARLTLAKQSIQDSGYRVAAEEALGRLLDAPGKESEDFAREVLHALRCKNRSVRHRKERAQAAA